ncbi:hypothetical protein [Nonomuraea turkmeniaca]|uniref:rhamnogalacturonan lyase family protein n=1 Tax=Nonomuraea turkmeniaca TaxID=103838 RepID=UPI0024832977|nr:hypothetical protein [Nonomuraea turkmeniaca]
MDGDGQYEIILKWDPSNAKDNSQSGYTGNAYVDAYRLNGSRLWRIDLGRNIRAGAHYTQFQVYDYDGDGRAEVAMKTADGTRDGAGTVIGNSSADHRNSSRYILAGPEYLTMFNGLTGAAMSTVNYDPPRGTVSSWGDNYGNRVDRFLARTAYLDGERPSLIMARGYYTRSVIAAWDFCNGTLTKRWTFDSNSAGSQYAGQGSHSLSVGDVDADGRDEIVYGAMAVNDNGTGMWSTRTGHGDAQHLGDFDPARSGLEYFKVSESTSQPGSLYIDPRTGQILWSTASGSDNGRGVAGDISTVRIASEFWSAADGNLRSVTGNTAGRKPSSINFLAWWDADPVRELLDQTRIDKYETSSDTRRHEPLQTIAPIGRDHADDPDSPPQPATVGDHDAGGDVGVVGPFGRQDVADGQLVDAAADHQAAAFLDVVLGETHANPSPEPESLPWLLDAHGTEQQTARQTINRSVSGTVTTIAPEPRRQRRQTAGRPMVGAPGVDEVPGLRHRAARPERIPFTGHLRGLGQRPLPGHPCDAALLRCGELRHPSGQCPASRGSCHHIDSQQTINVRSGSDLPARFPVVLGPNPLDGGKTALNHGSVR